MYQMRYRERSSATSEVKFFAFERIEDEWYMKKLSEVKKSPSKYTNWYIEDGMLYKRSYNALLDPVSNAENSWRLVVPAEQRERVLTESHCLTSSGHLGAKKTYDRLACEYWWPGMWYAVEEYCNSCDVCQRYKVPQTGPKGLMTRRVVDRPWAVVAADMMEFPRSKNQNKYCWFFKTCSRGGLKLYRYAKRTVWSATPTRSNGVRLPPLSGEQPEGLHRQSGRRWTSERGASSSERNASEEARASQEAVAELNEYVRLMELGVPARLRPEPEGRAVVEVSGELIPVFARPSMHASEDAMDWEESVQPGNYSWQRPAWQQRTDADRRRASRQRRQASGVGTRQRTPSPGEGRRPNGGGEPLLEEETRAMLEQLVAARQPVEEWDGEAFEEFFVARLKRKFVVGGGGGDGYASSLSTRTKAPTCRFETIVSRLYDIITPSSKIKDTRAARTHSSHSISIIKNNNNTRYRTRQLCNRKERETIFCSARLAYYRYASPALLLLLQQQIGIINESRCCCCCCCTHTTIVGYGKGIYLYETHSRQSTISR
ncbi:unnamed protein product [Trichogramma brassicae]|uniref:Integrase zinc-binding domain-containing protein n=1 Tax=Trichogramma brassicae TaxID=86971 RepID=A0A6H5I6M0_9HYME|nr:unnamed protein product [Trichogramma brassicae]